MVENSGKLITLEGSEGVGKTTSLNFVKSYIESLGNDVLVTREPGGTPLAEEIRNLLLQEREEEVDINAELLLMFASRVQHISQIIKPALNKGIWVICDRFVDASYAYQGGGRGISFDRITQLEQWCLGGFTPDLTLLLDMSSDEGIKRTKIRGKADRFEIEKMDFYKKIRQAYLERAKTDQSRIKIIDAAPAIDIVQEQILEVLTTHPSLDPAVKMD